MKHKVAIFGISGLLLTAGGSTYGQDPATSPEEAGVSQNAGTLKENNMVLSRKIAYLYKLLEGYNDLFERYRPDKPVGKADDPQEQWRKVTQTPRQTIFKYLYKDAKADPAKTPPVGISLVHYDFIWPEGKYGVSEPIGTRSKTVELYFDNKKLTKIVSEIEEIDFFNHTTRKDTVTDNAPQTDEKSLKYVPYEKNGVKTEKIDKVDDIQFVHIYTHGARYEKTLGDMKLEISNPHRILFKQDFYIKHLVHFENLFRLTNDYQRFKRDDKDVEMVNELKRSLEY